MNAAERVENAYRNAYAGSSFNRDAKSWDVLVELAAAALESTNESAEWHAAALGEFLGAVRMFATMTGLPRVVLKTFVRDLAEQRIAAGVTR